MKNNWRVGIYLRLSNEDRDKEFKSDSESIKNQRNLLLDYIKKQENFRFVKEYCDEDLSGAGTYRPAFENLIEDCKTGKLDVVLCKSQSRFSRDMEIVEKYINNKFKEWNVRFIGLADNADTDNQGNKKARQINGLVNEWYLEDVSNNIRSAFKAKMKCGEYISPFAVFGYNVVNNKLEIDEKAARIVKKIYGLYLEGYGYTAIAKYLNDAQIPSPSFYKHLKGIKLNIVSKKRIEDIKWSGNAIKAILNNEVYLGHLIQGKRTTISYKNHKIRKKDRKEWIKVANTHQAIIEEDTFNKVQIERKKRFKPSKKNGMVHIFSHKVICAECRAYLRKKTSAHEYLVCEKCKAKTSIRYDALTKIILEEINKLLVKYYDDKRLSKLRWQNKENFKIKALEEEKQEIGHKIRENETYLENLYQDKVEGNINLEEFKKLIYIYDKNSKDYNKLKEVIEKKIENLKHNSNLKEKKYQKLNYLNRAIVGSFIDDIYINKKVKKEQKVTIKWGF